MSAEILFVVHNYKTKPQVTILTYDHMIDNIMGCQVLFIKIMGCQVLFIKSRQFLNETSFKINLATIRNSKSVFVCFLEHKVNENLG